MTQTLNILHTEASTGWGGQEIRILQESEWLAKRGHKVRIVCAADSGIYKRYYHCKISNLSIGVLPFKRTLDPLDITGVYRMVRREKVDIIHTHSSIDSWNASIGGMLAGVPIVRSRHVSIPVKNFFPRNLVYKFPDKIITSGKHIADMMAELNTVSPDKIVSIPAGVNPDRFNPDINGAHVREEFHIPKDAILIGKVAVIRSWKGHPDFINAAEIVLRKKNNVYFLIVGGGPGVNRTRKTIREKNLEDKIIMTGYREDIPEIIRSLDVLVLASVSGEATSQVIPQAWGSKRCVLATIAGGICDIVRHEENGILVPPHAPEQMAAGLVRLVESPELRMKLAEAGHSFVMQHLTEEKMMEKTLSVYKDLIEAKKTV